MMYKFVLEHLIIESVKSMPKLSKSQWTTVAVSVVAVLGVMWAINNVKSVEDVAKKAGVTK